MNLDDFSSFLEMDTRSVLSEIDDLPGQLASAWALGQTLQLPKWEGIEGVLIAGVGGMAVSADLLAAYISPACPVPVFVNRGYDLPAWATGQKTLVIALLPLGESEEILSAFEQAIVNGCCILAICSEGELASRAGTAVWQFDHPGSGNTAPGYHFGLLLAAFFRLGLIPDPAVELAEAVAAMKFQGETLRAEVPLMMNPAKRLAGQCMGRWVSVIGADFLEPVARHLKNQVNQMAKAWAQFDFLPEADHNTLAGVAFPEQVIPNTFVMFLQGSANHPRNRLRVQLTKEIMMLEGVGTDFVFATGDSLLAQMWTLLQYGDYFAYYLAMLYSIDPAPATLVDELKNRLKDM